MEEVHITLEITKEAALPLRRGLTENKRAKALVKAFINNHQLLDGATFYCRAYITDGEPQRGG